jgi:FtsP/CotA-like multicopper oxidase with cupredoxin domain
MPSHSMPTTMYRHSTTAIGDRAHQQRFCRSSTDYQRAVPGSLVAARGWRRRVVAWGCASIFAISLPIHPSRAEELASLPICSASTAALGGLQSICRVTSRPGGRREIKINLTPQAGKIFVGGYSVETERYNGSYLASVVEAMPGDTVAARLVNRLQPRVPSDGHAGHGPANENPTNLHYFHGGIVTPKNARPPDDAGQGNGDNIFVYLKNGTGADETMFSFEYSVPIPGKGELDARVLEGDGDIEHPRGLNWYHSHLHGRSSDQVMGGLSGLLSVGDDKANVVACRRDPRGHIGCAARTASSPSPRFLM